MAWFYNPIFAQDLGIGLVAPVKPCKSEPFPFKIPPFSREFDVVFHVSPANSPLSPSTGHVRKNAVLSAFFEFSDLRAAHAISPKKTFSVFSPEWPGPFAAF